MKLGDKCRFVWPLPARWQCSFGFSFNQWHHWIIATTFLILCASGRLKYHTVQKIKRTTATTLSSLSTVSFDPWGHVLTSGWGVLWVWCHDCRKAQEMNVLSAHARKTRLQRGRRNKYLNLTHLLLPSQTKQAEDSFLSSDKTRFSLAWWGLRLLRHFHIWYLEWEYCAWLVETVGLDLWCLLSRARLRLCSTSYSLRKTVCGRRWRSASIGGLGGGAVSCSAAKFRTREIVGVLEIAGLWLGASQSNLYYYRWENSVRRSFSWGSDQHHSPDWHTGSVLWVEDCPSHLFPFQFNSILKAEPRNPLENDLSFDCENRQPLSPASTEEGVWAIRGESCGSVSSGKNQMTLLRRGNVNSWPLVETWEFWSEKTNSRPELV